MRAFFRPKNEAGNSPRRKRLSKLLSPDRARAESINDGPFSSSAAPSEPTLSSLPTTPHRAPGSHGFKFDVPSTSLPPAPSEDSSLLHAFHEDRSSHFNTDNSAMDERDMARKLMDVESSFLPEPLPAGHSRTTADVDNSFASGTPLYTSERLQGSSPEAQRASMRSDRSRSIPFRSQSQDHDRSFQSATSNSETFQTPATRPLASRHKMIVPDEDELDYSDSSLTQPSSLQHSSSSATAAAAQRSRLRVAAHDSSSRLPSEEIVRTPLPSTSEDMEMEENDATPKQLRRSASHSLAQVHHRLPSPSRASLQPNSNPKRVASLPDDSAEQQFQMQRHPSYLTSQLASQRNSTSSFLSNDVPSEAMMDADFGLQSDRAVPGSRDSMRASHDLTRLPSFGSVASSISTATEYNSRRSPDRDVSGNLASSGEADELVQKLESPPVTPGRAIPADREPTGTVLAQHVRDVEVPDTVAKEYQASRVPKSFENEATMSPPYHGRGRTPLTLKEQNSRIDKLSKENFDLKLKIHYLYQALQDRSDEGVKDLVSKNAQFQTDLVKAKKENQSLRRRLKDLERKQKDRAGPLSITQLSHEGSEDERSSRSFIQAQMEEEVLYLRDRMRYLEQENQKLSEDSIGREFEKRQLAERVKVMGDRQQAEFGKGTDESADAWKGLLDNEIALREQAEREVQDLNAELAQFGNNRSPIRSPRPWSRYNSLSNGEPTNGDFVPSVAWQDRNDTSMSGTTIVDQLRHENAGLRRDLGAQTSMLTSRNRERERLQQEIEDLKLVQRHGEGTKSSAGDSILDRSVSRANYRPTSRGSASTRASHPSDVDRDKHEKLQANLRDENAALKLRHQELQRDFNDLNDGVEGLQADLEEAVRELQGADSKSADDKDYYENEIRALEELMQEKEQDIEQLLADLNNREAELSARESEIKEVTSSFNRILDDRETSEGDKQDLQRELVNARGEYEALESNLRDAVDAKQRLEVQAESSQNEISFLREEQEGDKLKISDLQSALRNAKTNLQDERERLKDIDEVEEANRKTKEELRRLKSTSSAQNVELAITKERLQDWETGLREGFGKFDGTGSRLLGDVRKLQKDLERTLQDLESANTRISEMDGLIKDRETLLETSGLETRRLTDILDKERQARKHDQNEYERERTRKNSERSGKSEFYITELETARDRDKNHMASVDQRYSDLEQQCITLEKHYTEQLVERNALLLNTWTRLSTLCGTKWAEKYQLDDNTISRDFPTFNTTLLTAVKALAKTINTFRTRIRSTEKDIWKDFQSLERALDVRCKRMDTLESAVQRHNTTIINNNNETTPTPDASRLARDADHAALTADLASLRDENNLLRRELNLVKKGFFALPGLPTPSQEDYDLPSPNEHLAPPLLHTALGALRPSDRDHAAASLQRHHSGASTSAGADPTATANATAATALGINGDGAYANHRTPLAPSEQRWILRLKELERRLKAEREARLLDRSGARKRLEEGMLENERLRGELHRERERSRGRTMGNGG